jgi:hypothetical protein
MLFKKTGLPEQSEADWVHTLSKACISRENYPPAKINRDCFVISQVCLAAYSASKRFGQFENIQFQQKGQAQRKQTSICTRVREYHAPDRFAIRGGKSRKGQWTICSCSIGINVIWRQGDCDVWERGLCHLRLQKHRRILVGNAHHQGEIFALFSSLVENCLCVHPEGDGLVQTLRDSNPCACGHAF